MIQAGHSALWYNPDQSGHGINIYLLQDKRILVFWYVYDNDGNPIWLLATGTHDGNKALLNAGMYTGGVFPPGFDPNDIVSTAWGTFELEFSNCNESLFKWTPVANNGFNSGQMSIIRLNNTLGLECIDPLD